MIQIGRGEGRTFQQGEMKTYKVTETAMCWLYLGTN